MKATVSIFWFRRDLRLEDNTGLYYALKQSPAVLPIFIFDKNILEDLDRHDRRVQFIHDAVRALQAALNAFGASLEVVYGYPQVVFSSLFENYNVTSVFTNHDYEPYATERDDGIRKLLEGRQISFHSFKDQVLFEKSEVVKDNDAPYTVFSPYLRKWMSKLSNISIPYYDTAKYFSHFYIQEPREIPTLAEMGFSPATFSFPSAECETDLLNKYEQQRDFPGLNGTSRLGVHLRVGTISIRKLAEQALKHSRTFLNELVWREFYQMILWNFPQIGEGKSFKPEYDRIEWRNNTEEFELWKQGRTGYPLVDAGMRELAATGFMHNRVRMVVASFLTKHLLIDWRWGEAWFAENLLDFELASNNGGWQWASGSGCDAAPYFRIFNPYLQAKKFDPECKYVSRWVPEYREFTYPPPIVDHEFARKRCIEVYGKALAR